MRLLGSCRSVARVVLRGRDGRRKDRAEVDDALELRDLNVDKRRFGRAAVIQTALLFCGVRTRSQIRLPLVSLPPMRGWVAAEIFMAKTARSHRLMPRVPQCFYVMNKLLSQRVVHV